MTIHTVSSLRTTRRLLARRMGRMEKAATVLDEMKRGGALHLSYTHSAYARRSPPPDPSTTQKRPPPRLATESGGQVSLSNRRPLPWPTKSKSPSSKS
jgi:hypothetical protein